MFVAKAGALAIALVTPALSLAQESNAPVTRAQVRAELVQLEAAGYKRAPHDVKFPEDFQAAEAVVSQPNSSDVPWQGANKDKR